MIETEDIRRLSQAAKQVLVAGHVSPDGDCVGAMLSLRLALSHWGISSRLVLPDPVGDSLQCLPGVSEIVIAPAVLPDFDLAIVPDCSDLGRLGPLYDKHKAAFDRVPMINVDHHVSNTLFGTVNLVDATASAVCEQLYFLLSELAIPVGVEIATCLLTGIVTDTQGFRTPSTTPRSLRAAGALAELGARISEIADRAFNTRSLATLRLWGLALSALKESRGVVWTRLNEAMLCDAGATWDESEPLVSLLSTVRPASAAILFKEMPEGSVRVSLRSAGTINAAAIAAEFGGGGHFGAAGCTLSMPIEVAEAIFVARVHAALEDVPADETTSACH